MVRSNADEVAARLKSWAASAEGIIQKVLGSFAAEEEGRLEQQPYPAQRAGQEYSRTRDLAAGWTVEANGFQIEAGNTTPYAHWVVDANYQAWFHAGRWWTAQEVVQQHTFSFLPDKIAEELIDSYE